MNFAEFIHLYYDVTVIRQIFDGKTISDESGLKLGYLGFRLFAFLRWAKKNEFDIFAVLKWSNMPALVQTGQPLFLKPSKYLSIATCMKKEKFQSIE